MFYVQWGFIPQFFCIIVIGCLWHCGFCSTGMIFACVALVVFSSSSVFFGSHLVGYIGTFKIFNASVSLIRAFIWLTDSMFNESKKDVVLIWSFINVPFKNLVSLFWVSQMLFAHAWVPSDSDKYSG